MVSNINAQERHSHNVFWFRVGLSDTITSRLKWDVWIQYRRQNSVESKSNLFAEPQVRAYWLWLHYSLSKSVNVSVSPFTYFETHVLNVVPSDELRPAVKEFRWLLRADHTLKGRYFNFINRCNVEYRYRDLQNDGSYIPNWRVRYMARLEKPVNNLFPKPITFFLFDEMFIQFGEAVKNNPSLFDQNRLCTGFNYEILPKVRTSLGYIYTVQSRNAGKEIDDINTLWIILSFDNIFSQFKKRSTQ